MKPDPKLEAERALVRAGQHPAQADVPPAVVPADPFIETFGQPSQGGGFIRRKPSQAVTSSKEMT